MPLTSETGKISGLDCWRDGDEIEVIAIERHFEVTRLLSFHVPATGAIAALEPTITADLHRQKRAEENLEGIVRTVTGSLAIVIDNEHKKVACENRLLFVQ